MNRLFGSSPEKVADRLFCILCAALGLYLFVRHALGAFAPFIISAAVSVVIDLPATRISRTLGISKRICSVILLILSLLLLSVLLFWGINRLTGEGERLITHLTSREHSGILSELLGGGASINIGDSLHFDRLIGGEAMEDIRDSLREFVNSAVSEAVSSITVKIPGAVLAFMSSLPRHVIAVTVTLVSSFYFCLDFDRIKASLLSRLPERITKPLPALKARAFRAILAYIRAYLFILILTFCQLFVGFSLLKAPYPLTIAILVALIDILPVLGVGVVLIPWGILELAVYRNIPSGLGLLALYVIITVVRQIAEPRVISKSLGLHPLVTLFSMYAGLCFFGLFGMILLPPMLHLLFGAFGKGIDKEADM